MGMFATILIVFFSVVGLCLLISFMQLCCPISCMMVASCRKKKRSGDVEGSPTAATVIISSSPMPVTLDDFVEKPPTYEEAVRQP
ncbi:hypothetical protein TYRP_010867 [Tyrophagus putrescentiae]|nr:hypothetical protein TYRP_010867 [Tyrophagus putrescentiae]